MSDIERCSRRHWLLSGAAGASALAAGAGQSAMAAAMSPVGPAVGMAGNTSSIKSAEQSIRFCFNTSCLRGQKLPIETLVRKVADAGYDGVEVWIDELDAYTARGERLETLGQQCSDLGLRVEGAIAFANWLVPDEQQAAAEWEKARRDMEKVAKVGGTTIAAPPVGQNETPITDWRFAAERLAKLAKLGREMGVTPQLELWGFSQAIGNLSQLMQLASATESRDFGILLDVYHLYKGSSSFDGLRLLNGRAMSLFHVNDYPGDITREKIGDRDRVFPGEGVAPLAAILGDLSRAGFAGALSLELFNPDYWAKDADWVLQTGLASMKRAWDSRATQDGR
jgi:2-keto-myo-inositol isomerase